MKKTCSNSTSLHQRQLNLSKLPESSCGASFKDNQHHQFLFSIASARELGMTIHFLHRSPFQDFSL